MITNISWLYLLQAVTYVLPLVTVPFLFRTLGPDRFGVIVFAQTTMQYFVLVTDYGFSLSATRAVAIRRTNGANLSEVFTAVVVSKCGLLVASFFLLLGLTTLLPRFGEERILFHLAFMAVVGSVLLPVWFFQGMERMAFISALNIGARLAALVALVLVVHAPSDYVAAVAIQSGAVLISGGVGLALALSAFGVRIVRPSRNLILETLRDGWRVFASTAAINLYTTTNVFVLGLVSSNVLVGFYGSADRLIRALQSLVIPASQALYPRLSIAAVAAPELALRLFQRSAAVIITVFVGISAGVFILAQPIVTVLYGSGLSETVLLVRILSVSIAILAAATCYATLYMLSFGHSRAWSLIILSAGAVDLVSLAALSVILPTTRAVAVTTVVVEAYVLVRSYVFYRGQLARSRGATPAST